MGTTVLSFAFVLGVLILVHELGHFIAAKLMGIRVERFSIGFPPRAFGKKIGDTDYCISWLPLGGYVKLAGMIDETLDRDTIHGEPWEFQSKPIWKRTVVILAGSFMNFLLAMALFSAITYFAGIAEVEGPIVGGVAQGSPAEQIGLKPGDRITKVDNTEIQRWDQLTAIIHHRPGQGLTLQWKREGREFVARVTPTLDRVRNIGLIGIEPKVHFRRASIFESVQSGVSYSIYVTKLVVVSLKMIITGQESIKSALAGPVFIAKMAGESARSGFGNLIAFMAFLSLNLGLLNILPVPVLDGGHLVFLGIEAVRRKPLSVKTRLVVQQVGMALLVALMVFIIINDVRRIW